MENDQLPRLSPNVSKIIEAILYVIGAAEQRGFVPSQYDIVKTLFLADKSHLDEFGRPVTFDNYVAMKHGPVPSLAYDMLKPGFDWGQLGVEAPPWSRKARPGGGLIGDFSTGKRSANVRRLSATDTNALERALSLVRSLSFTGLREYTHRNPAYVAAWRDDEAIKAFQMDYRLIMDVPDADLVSDLEDASRHS